jgi:acetylornithine/succinyldiaminopimelate/putrescine aminotransferase
MQLDHGTTFGGSPFATIVGLHVFKRLSAPSFLAHVHTEGEYFRGRLQAMAQSYPSIITHVRGVGLMLGMQLDAAYPNGTVVDACRARGLLVVGAGLNVLRIVPPLIIQRHEVDEACEVLEAVVSDLAQKK